MKYYSEDRVKKLLEEQKILCKKSINHFATEIYIDIAKVPDLTGGVELPSDNDIEIAAYNEYSYGTNHHVGFMVGVRFVFNWLKNEQ